MEDIKIGAEKEGDQREQWDVTYYYVDCPAYRRQRVRLEKLPQVVEDHIHDYNSQKSVTDNYSK